MANVLSPMETPIEKLRKAKAALDLKNATRALGVSDTIAASNKALPLATKAGIGELAGIAGSSGVALPATVAQISRPIGNYIAENTKQSYPTALPVDKTIYGKGSDVYMKSHTPYNTETFATDVTKGGVPLTREALARTQDVLGSTYAANRLREPDQAATIKAPMPTRSALSPEPKKEEYTPSYPTGLVNTPYSEEEAKPQTQAIPKFAFDPAQLDMIKGANKEGLDAANAKFDESNNLMRQWMSAEARNMPSGYGDSALAAIQAGGRFKQALGGLADGLESQGQNITTNTAHALPAYNAAYTGGEALSNKADEATIAAALKRKEALENPMFESEKKLQEAHANYWNNNAKAGKEAALRGDLIERMIANAKTDAEKEKIMERFTKTGDKESNINPQILNTIEMQTDPAYLKSMMMSMSKNDPHLGALMGKIQQLEIKRNKYSEL